MNRQKEQLLIKRNTKLEKELAAKNRELEIEAALEKVRAVAMSMMKPDDLSRICKILYKQLLSLGFGELRNTQINIHNDEEKSFLNYEYTDDAGVSVTPYNYKSHPVVSNYVKQIRKAKDTFSEFTIKKDKLKEWKKLRKKHGEKEDLKLKKASELYYFFYSIGNGSIGISALAAITSEQRRILKRFRNVFDLAYKRYTDISKVEAQAREAQIQLALERVRARTMAMQRSEELSETAYVLFQQFTQLGENPIQITIGIIKEEEGIMEFRVTDWGGSGSKVNTGFNVSIGEPTLINKIFKAWKKNEKSIIIELRGEELEGWLKYRNKVSGVNVKSTDTAGRRVISVAFFSKGMVAFSSPLPPPQESVLILERFAGVFDLTYTRFLDLKNAEEQAREAQIQLALERVRARTMAMQKSDELLDTSLELFQQLKELGEPAEQLTIGVIKEDKKIVEVSATLKGLKLLQTFNHDIEEPFVMKKMVRAWKTKQKTLVLDQQWEELKEYNKYRNKLVKADMFPIDLKPGDQRLLYVAFFSNGSLGLSSNEPRPNETLELLERFAKVFDQTYTRFLDLQKAEAQAREAQIEAALERVRSRSMGMQKSEELKEVIQVVYDQFIHLNIKIEHTGFLIDYKERDDMHIWLADQHLVPSEVTIPWFDSPPNNSIKEAKEKGQDFFTYHLTFEEKNKFYQDLFKFIPGVPEETLEYYLNCPGLAGSGVLLENIGLYIENFSGIPYSKEDNAVLMRFGKVFQQTYTRFLDLQKAEAQAREAKIEMALEKIRSRTMAMQHSDELPEAANLLFLEVQALGIPAWSCGYNVLAEDKKTSNCWMSSEGAIQEPFNLYFTEEASFIEWYNFIQSDENFFVQELGGEALVQHYNYMRNIPKLGEVIKKLEDAGISLPTYQINHLSKYAYGFLLFITYEPVPDAHDLFKRFTTVFEQTYTRFLDLQKAEAQARESQIQLALERARAQSMMMQHSKELDDTLRVFHGQVLLLNIPSAFSFLWLPDEKKDRHIFWAAWAENNSTVFKSKAINYPLDRNEPATEQCLIDWKSNEPVVSYHVPPDGVKNYFAAWSELIAGVEQLKPEYFNDGLYYVEAFMKYGCFGVMVKNELPEEEKKILYRFTVEFERTYTRFLDLQKAEAQAREAQIEAALERVRAKAMSMHKGEDLNSAVAVVFEELDKLQLGVLRCGIAIIDKEKPRTDVWTTIKSDFGNAIQVSGDEPLDYHPMLQSAYDAWKRGEDFYYVLKNEELRDYYETIKQINFQQAISLTFDPGKEDQVQHYYNAVFENGSLFAFLDTSLIDEAKKIVKRFAGVFNLTYKRFLDLQKAETQAREAQIEAALERVRARSLAMHKPDEIAEVAKVLRNEMALLGVEELETSSIYIVDKEKQTAECWYAIKDVREENKKLVSDEMLLDLNETWVGKEMWKFYKSKQKQTSIVMKGENRKQWINYCASKSKVLQGYYGDEIPERTYHLLKFSHGYMGAASPGEISKKSWDLLQRATSVFSFAYTRFLDLQQAAARTRETKIELALERVRARTMAMFKSEELGEVATVMFKELNGIVENLWTCGFVLCEKERAEDEWWVCTEGGFIPAFYLPNVGDVTHANIYQGWLNGETYHTEQLEGKDLQEHYDWLMGIEVSKKIFEDLSAAGYEKPEWQKLHCAYFSKGYLCIITREPCTEEEIFKRFAQAFDLTYTRFLDLQKAEAQAREAKIETSLERVRSKTMAMHNSHDVAETVAAMFEELVKLGVETLRCGILIGDQNNQMEVWTAKSNKDHKADLIVGRLDMTIHPLLWGIYKSWQEKQPTYSYEMIGDDLKEYYKAINNTKDYPVRFDIESMPQHQFHNDFYFAEGSIFAFTAEQLSPEASRIFKRFSAVFGQTYRRYLDLQKAEAQAREAQIEAGLERVRSKTMAMHNSSDLTEAASALFTEMNKLNINPIRTGFVLLTNDSRKAKLYPATSFNNQKTVSLVGEFEFTGHPIYEKQYESWQKKENYFPVLEGEILKSYYRILAKGLSVPYENFPTDKIQFGSFLPFSEGFLFTWSEQPYSETEINILNRFKSILDLTIRRYLDLQKAEAQAREAQIEAALEKVRSRSLAMHKSDELKDVVTVVNQKLEELGVLMKKRSAAILVFEEGKKDYIQWAASPVDNKSISLYTPYHDNIIQKDIWEARQNKTDYYTKAYTKEEKNELFNFYFSHSVFGILSEEERQVILESEYYEIAMAFEKNSALAIVGLTGNQLSKDEGEVLKRFGKVFEQAYIRFLDLQKAEAQAREATIEAALEKVRGKAMAMHNSSDLSVTASLVFTELRKLGIRPIGCGVGLLNKESKKAQLYSATFSASGDSLSLVGWVQSENHPVLENIYDAWLQQKDCFPELQGEQLKSYYQLLSTGLSVPVPDFTNEQKRFGHFISFSIGCLYAWSDVRYNDEEIKILKRFATIIDLTFRRYIELQKSETNVREAVKQAALDRIRADIASMRTITDLDRITPLIWNELTILDISFIRCGVFIMDELQQLIHTFLSTPDGKAIAAFHIPYDTPGNIKKVLSHWHNRKRYIDHWDESAFTEFAQTLVKQGALDSSERYLQTIPHGGFYLHFFPFLQGMLYVGNTTQLNEEEIKLIQSVADAFSTAYARYEDFNKLEAAKTQVEKTLVDLKQAQTQLVQSEKMASLGELTAGIAHEIQNPLNFVNNFSEVSNELIEEMKDELAKGNYNDAIDIANDVKQNLEKINHHGKRADAIVKGMLQHSRTSSGQKELTDINVLADEYLRLAYHGLRAKDKSFNAKFETDFDNSIEKINIVPQEMGRVILNLINNAFYAASAKTLAAADSNYQPTVTVSTKKIEDRVEIKVKDNGNGIPQKILDKIFQPFFTTKPSGQGTGLGLSLSYDIVKAHGGEIRVETREGEGSEFIIQLAI